jgi:predicted transcriptional regulator
LDGPRTLRLVALLALGAIVALTIAHGEAEAAMDKQDWRVAQDLPPIVGETINVAGTLTVELNGTLELVGCDLRFTNATPSMRVAIVRGAIVLNGTSVSSTGHGSIVVEGPGSMAVEGTSRLLNIDTFVQGMATLQVRDASLTVRGTSPDDLSSVDVQGVLGLHRSTVLLQHATVSTIGSVNMSDSTIDGRDSWAEGDYDRLALLDGDVVARGVRLKDLYGGVPVLARLLATDCTFMRADLMPEANGWRPTMRVTLVGCEFDSSSILMTSRDDIPDLEVEVSLQGCELTGGAIVLNLTSPYRGSVVMNGITVSSWPDYAVEIRLSGVDGRLEVRDLAVTGPYGLLATGDFSGLVLDGATLDTTEVGVNVAGRSGRLPATITDVQIVGAARGIVGRNVALTATGCDLMSTVTPVMVDDEAFVNLVDCEANLGRAVLDPVTVGAQAWLYASRTIEVSSTLWWNTQDIPIRTGVVDLDVTNGSAWDTDIYVIGTLDFPTMRLLEAFAQRTALGDLDVSRVEFHRLEGRLELQGHVFRTHAPLDPWSPGPYDLQFVDDAPPSISYDQSLRLVVSEPSIAVSGTVSDMGAGLEGAQWKLLTAAMVVDSSSGLGLSEGGFSVVIKLTGNYMRVRIEATDLAGNTAWLDTNNILVDVAPPTITITSPHDGELTNDEHVTISGIAGGYATEVVVRIEDLTVRLPVDERHLFYTAAIMLPHQGPIELFFESHDPFLNVDQKRIVVELDTYPPVLDVEGLRRDAPNYVNVPVLVVQGSTSDPEAIVRVDGQVVGVLANRSFATTVELREGRQTIRVEAWDAAGNRERADYIVILDLVPPTLTVARPASNPFYTTQDTVAVEVGASEALLRITRDGLPTTLAGDRLTFAFNFQDDGREDSTLVATDLAGNEARLTVTVVRDTVAPTLTIISPKGGEYVSTVTVQLMVRVSESPCTLLIDGEPREARDAGFGRLLVEAMLMGGDGPHRVTVRAEDGAGNGVEAAIDIVLDTTAPFITLEGLSEGARVTTEPLEVRGRTEPGAKVVWVNGVMAKLEDDGSFKLMVELSSGEQELRVYVIDKAGNEGEEAITLEVLSAPSLDVPWEAAATGTVLLALAGLIASTEVGRWGLMLLFLPLYTKLRKEKILDQRTRGLIQGYIMANPGCNYTLLRDNLDLADGTLTYHLQVLEREGFVYSIREGLFRCFYPTGLPPPRRGKLHLSDTQADIVRICKRIPGITVGEIATAMNRRPNVISYHLKLLNEGGLITLEEDGRHVRVYPVEAAVAMI